MIPARLWSFSSPDSAAGNSPGATVGGPQFQLHPHYRSARPLDSSLLQVQTGLDEFVSEKFAEQIAAILAEWSKSLLRSSADVEAFAKTVSADFSGTSLHPVESTILKPRVPGSSLQVWKNKFGAEPTLGRGDFLRDLQTTLGTFSKILTAEFQITRINVADGSASDIQTRIRYEIVGTGTGFHREQRVGYWQIAWQKSSAGELRVRQWQSIEETQARSSSPAYIDITAAALGSNSSYASQLMHGTDYWRSVLDGACGIDIYGHCGVSAADIDNDGHDDLYVCQPAGLPNRLYRNRGDGSFDDITELSGLGILENSVCALFADFRNSGRQDVIVVRANGPLFFMNEGNGRFHARPDAFHFANSPQGTFTGAAIADYDRDGWLDIYFCLYAYYQGTGQYRYPSPYHDAKNGPPNFLMQNNHDGTFRDVTANTGLNQNNTRYSFCCGWNDYNGDGWPDLYVVNDFGRKNLYRNNGDGTFTDVAAAAGAEDVGAGMSVSWSDYDGNGRDDLYIANMWTAAGERISTQEIFKKDSSPEVRALYQKHAMGNSLLRNRDGLTFDDVTSAAGCGLGRWSWASDCFDFDHDGFPDIYIANGMVSGPSRQDLNSFFWRRIVARSPDDNRASKEYEQGWNAINELIRSDGTWSGYERNVFYVNNSNGTFSDISAAIGMDFIEDGRSFALADFDHDGRLEIFLKNRNAPQLRILKNVMPDLPASISFRLQGTKSNRDAIGASVAIETSDGRRQTRMLRAGSAFLSQHSKEISFGLGNAGGPVKASIRWPSGVVQHLDNLPGNRRIWVEEGSANFRAEAFTKHSEKFSDAGLQTFAEEESLPEDVETWLLDPVSAPDFSLPDQSGKSRALASFRGKSVLVNFWTTKSPLCIAVLKLVDKADVRRTGQEVQFIAINVDNVAADSTRQPPNDGTDDFAAFLRGQQFSFPMLRASDDVAAIYNILYRQLFDRHRDMSLPTSFLIDSQGDIVKVYQGRIDPERVSRDVQDIPATDRERLASALPFPSANQTLDYGRNYLSWGALYFQRGYLAQAETSFHRASRNDPSSAEALYGIGSVYLNQNKNAEAKGAFERAAKLTANYPDTLPDTWNNLGVIATREGRIDDSIECFQRALQLNPHHLLSLDNLANAYRLQKRWPEARALLERALAVDPEDAEANYSLGMVYAQTDDTAKAYEYLQRASKARPAYPEALNNLGVLYLVTQRESLAVQSFEKCIKLAPQFDQAYLNLARVYALEGSRDQAKSVLQDLLKQHPDHPQATQMLKQLDQ